MNYLKKRIVRMKEIKPLRMHPTHTKLTALYSYGRTVRDLNLPETKRSFSSASIGFCIDMIFGS
jgi:hypothetical protein